MRKLVYIFFLFSFLFINTINSKEKNKSSPVYAVFAKILSTLESPGDFIWPPVLQITDDPEIYAFSIATYNQAKDKFAFTVKLSNGLIENFVKSDNELLAFILSHELSHIINGHLTENLDYKTDAIKKILNIDEELQADADAIRISADAGYSIKKTLKSLQTLALGENNISSFECLSKEHPPWSDRLSKLDENNKTIWKTLSTFKNGCFFLSLNEYEPAIYCFENVVDQQSNCHEAYNNLGYAKLMNYLDLLEPEDYLDLNIGQIVTGCYYSNAKWINSLIRGIDIDLWWEAVGAFKQSLSIKQDQPLVKANLALAYLVSPLRNIDMGKATENLVEVLDNIDSDTTLNELQVAGIYLNAGILISRKNEKDTVAKEYFAEAEKRIRKLAEFNISKKFNQADEINDAILYNKALSLSKSNIMDSLLVSQSLFNEYLMGSNTNTAWWEIAYQHYNNLSKKLHLTERSKEYYLKRNKSQKFHPVIGLTLKDKKYIILSEQKMMLLEQLKNHQFSETTVIPGKTLKKIRYRDLGIELFATEYIFAIILNNFNSPERTVSKTNGSKKNRITVGMDNKEFNSIFNNFKYIDNQRLVNLSDSYKYYPDLGIGIKVNQKTLKIDEIVITRSF